MILNGVEIVENDLITYSDKSNKVIAVISEIIFETNSIRMKDIYDLKLKKRIYQGYFVAGFETMKTHLTNLKVVGRDTLEDVIENSPEIFI